MTVTLKIAYIPEHFATPLFLAYEQKFFQADGLDLEFVPVPEGTGRLINLLNANEVDIAIGLTEGFIADVAKGNDKYKVIDTYVESPLCWAISTGYNRDEITKAEDLAGKAIGVSRIGSGSYIMSFVLGNKLKFPEPYFSEFPTLSNFKNLRDSVNHAYEDKTKYSDAFMWEHFTSKKYYDSKEIKKIGEIYTPWPSWVITVNHETYGTKIDAVNTFIKNLNKGIAYFLEHPNTATTWIATNLDYTKEDANEWLKTVKFNEKLGQAEINWEKVVQNTSSVLKTAGVLVDDDEIIAKRLEQGVIRKSY